MKIVLFGATGTIGTRILKEALSRGHEVTAVSRNPSKLQIEDSRIQKIVGDVLEADDVARVAAGNDAVVSAVGPSQAGGDPKMLIDSIESLHTGLVRAKVRRLIVVGGAGSLEVAPGKLLIDTAEFPEAWKPLASAAGEALKNIRKIEELDWTYLSPAGFIEPGERTGGYRTGLEQLVVDESGKSYISAEDYAVALLDELETPHHLRERFTVAY